MDLRDMLRPDKHELAKNTDTPRDILRELAKDDFNWIRDSVASNPNTPEDTLRVLANDEDHQVRGMIAMNPNTPEDLMQELAKDYSDDVREYVIWNTNISINILITLFEHEKSFDKPNNLVINALYQNKKLPEFIKRVIETLYGEML